MNADILTEMVAQMAGEPVVALSLSHLARTTTPRDGSRKGMVAIIPIVGALMPRSWRGSLGSYAGMDALRQQLNAAARNPEVASIVLDIDSPGGAVAGTAETAAAVAAAARRKPVVAVANSLAASAAYWIASQASEVVLAPHALAGSIGVLAIHQNVAGMMDRLGVDTTVVRSGARKAEGHPFGPLDATARAGIQARVDEAAAGFFDAVAAGRRMSQRVARDRFADGRVLGTREALATGLADRVATLDAVIAELAAGKMPMRARALAFHSAAQPAGQPWPRRSAAAFR